jgi:hypothetical protein
MDPLMPLYFALYIYFIFKSVSSFSFYFIIISFIIYFPAYSPLFLIKNSFFKGKFLNITITKERRSYLLLFSSLPSSLPFPLPLVILNMEIVITMHSPCNIYQQKGSLYILVRHSIYIKCISFKIHYATQLDGTFRVVILKLSLIFGKSKVGFHILL